MAQRSRERRSRRSSGGRDTRRSNGSKRLTIDALAQRTGMTVRNIRAHQSRGLLPPPELEGRTGYYGRPHIERIELIRQLQDDGFSLELIGRMLENAEGSSSEVLRFTHALREPFGDEEPRVVELDELLRRWPDGSPELLERAEKLGLVRALGDDRYEEPSPRLAEAATELAELGVPSSRAIEVAATLREHADSVAAAFIELFLDTIWKPFEEAGHPEDRWPEVQDALERLRPLASESLVATFQLAMNEAVDEAFGREVALLREQPAD
ncbi:MAG: MerR family transcriptional regulator [Thermoleophilaceae bacterium]